MKIRTQIAVAFFLLAIVPMAAIVLFSHASSLRMVRTAVEAEAEMLTADMEARLNEVQGEIRRRVERIGSLPVGRWALEDESEADREALFSSLVAELGDTAPLVQSFEFVRQVPDASSQAAPIAPTPSPDAPQPPIRPLATPHPAPLVIDMRGMLETVTASIENLDPGSLPAGTDKAQLIEDALRGFESIRKGAKVDEQETSVILRAVHEQVFLEASAAALTLAPRDETSESSFRIFFSPEVEVPIYADGAVVGELRARMENEELLRRVLGRTSRERGEIPFALDDDGRLFALQDEDRAQLDAIGLSESITADELAEYPILAGWVVVTSRDETSDLTFGIARPIEESIAEMRATAIRNFVFGSGLIGLALLGVFPLSRRMTRGLNLMTKSAERLAGGDLKARVPVESRNEIGQLARAFNNMAEDLEANQKKLVEGELLQVEFDRKSEELEEARRFQLSLLPKKLPEHSSFDLAATMKTATEVGGDYYDFRVADDQTLTVAIGDATGHGARAGTMVTAVKTLFSAFPPTGSLAEFQNKAAAGIRHMELGRMSMALTLARLTPSQLTVSAAGMPPVLLYRAAGGGLIEEIAVEGMPLGGLEFAYQERSVDLHRGDLLLLMSDGFPELPNSHGDTLGYERAGELFAAAAELKPREVIDHLLREAEKWTGGAAPADDITFVVIRIR